MSKKKNIGRLLGVPGDLRTFNDADPTKLVLNKCYVGMEIEIENFKKQPDYDRVDGMGLWQVHEDGSLRNRGMEFKFASPLCGDDILRAVRAFCSEAQRLGYETSERTGLHIHVDIRDLSPEQLHAMCLAYAVFEIPIFNYIAPDRFNSNFCVPWQKASGSVDSLGYLLYSTKDSDYINSFSGQHKYSALNLESARRFGTVEFRHAWASVNEDRIMEWVNICLALKKFALRFDGAPNEFLNAFSSGPEQLCRAIFEHNADLLLKTENFRRNAYKGMRLSLEMLTPLMQIDDDFASRNARTSIPENIRSRPRWDESEFINGVITTMQAKLEAVAKKERKEAVMPPEFLDRARRLATQVRARATRAPTAQEELAPARPRTRRMAVTTSTEPLSGRDAAVFWGAAPPVPQVFEEGDQE